jgi:adenylosuccinate synthase
MLDLDFGTYPYVTSSSTTIGGVCTGLGIPPKAIGHTIGVVKAYTTRVGGGPFPTEQLNVGLLVAIYIYVLTYFQHIGVHFQEVGKEYGTTTGRRRRCGWLDLVVMKHSCLINGYDSLNLTKLDVLDEVEDIKIGVKYMIDDKELQYFPGELTTGKSESIIHNPSADLDVLAKVTVVYVTLPGWKTQISSITSFDDLPDNCKSYVGFIENFLGTPIEWIGVGPGRESMLKKSGRILMSN